MGVSGTVRPGAGCQREAAPGCCQTGTPTLTPSKRPEVSSQKKSHLLSKSHLVQIPHKELLDVPGHLGGQSRSASLPKGRAKSYRGRQDTLEGISDEMIHERAMKIIGKAPKALGHKYAGYF